LIDSSPQHGNPHFIADANFSDTVAPSAALLDVWDGAPRTEFCCFANGRATHSYGNVRTSSCQPKQATFESCVFVNCSCAGEGGAFFAFWFNSRATVSRCWFAMNSSGKGKGRSVFIGNSRVKCEVRHCAFSGNQTMEIGSARSNLDAEVDPDTKFEQTDFLFAAQLRQKQSSLTQ
jgi:hypothetical protein